MNVTLAMHEHAQRSAQQLAVITPKERLTYGQLNTLVWRATRYFQEQGLRQGDRVGLLAPDSLLHLVAALGLSRLGVAYYAISAADLTAAVNTALASIDAKTVLVAGTGAEFGRPQIPISASLFFSTCAAASSDFAADAALIWRFVTSSGTTGRPKLFAVTQHNMLAQIRRLQLALPDLVDDISMAMSSLNFFSPTRRVFRHLADGGTVVLPGNAGLAELAAMIVGANVNRINAGPWLLPRFLAEPAYDAAFRKIKVLECGGSIVSNNLRKLALERYTAGFVVLYGTNELTPISGVFGADCLSNPETIGRSFPIGEVEVVNDMGTPVPAGEVGHIRIRDPGMIREYWNDPAASAVVFREGWFYPGDLASRTPSGELLFKGRADDMMIYDGINIYPSEIENCLMEHPAVVEVAAFALDDARRGSIPIAAVRIASPVSGEALRDFARERLGLRHPQAILILQDFPRNARGKVLKRELATMVEIS